MPRSAKPFKHRGWWVSKIGGKLTNLAKIEADHTSKNAPLSVWSTLAEKKDEFERNKPVAAVASDSLKTSLEKFLSIRQISDRTKGKYRDIFAKLLEKYGETPISKIGEKEVEIWRKWNESNSGVWWNISRVCLSAVWKWFMSEGLTHFNPWRRIEKKRENQRERVASKAEFQALMRNAKAEYRRILLFLRLSSCRPQDLEARWDWWKGDTIVIPAANHKTGTKTGKARIIYLPPVLVKLLSWMSDRKGTSQILFRRGRMFSQAFQIIRDNAGIKADSNGEQLCPYSLRHTRLTELGLSAPVAVVQAVAGHTSYAMTQRYIHADKTSIMAFLGK